jgi:hypothetical protein
MIDIIWKVRLPNDFLFRAFSPRTLSQLKATKLATHPFGNKSSGKYNTENQHLPSSKDEFKKNA